MPTLQVFDRINTIETESTNGTSHQLQSLPYEQYFGEMEFLTEEEKEERIALAKDLEDAMMFLFFMVVAQSSFDYMAAISSAEVKDRFREKMMDTISRHTEIDDDLLSQINDFVDDTTDTTYEHLVILARLMEEPQPDTDKQYSEEFYLSDDRARLLAEEESNTVFNYKGYADAVLLGATTKTWITMRDAFVRKTHRPLEDKTVPTTELFMVGESFMRFPRDQKFNAKLKEIIRCRCGVKYNR